MPLYRFFRKHELSPVRQAALVADAFEIGFYVEARVPITVEEEAILTWLLAETFEPAGFASSSFLDGMRTVLEVGPRFNFATAWSSTAVAICHACGLDKVTRLERSRRFGLNRLLTEEEARAFLEPLHDRMTEMPYASPPLTFESALVSAPSFLVDIVTGDWRRTLQEHSARFGCGFDEQDITFIGWLFRERLCRNPTDVELFQLAQANSEHSRHWFFKGQHVIDGKPQSLTLMDLVRAPQQANPANSVVAFSDDSSAIRGRSVWVLEPVDPSMPGRLEMRMRLRHPTMTAETHNHPSFIEPFEGAATGIGGCLRDVFCVGRGGLCGMSAAGYSVGALAIPGYDLPWERDRWKRPAHAASPLEILIQGSNGVSAYGNCFGEPLTFGYTRSFELTLADGKHRAYSKPILYVAGAGSLDGALVTKGKPEWGMLVVQLGGPAYRIGMGGGSASSMLPGESSIKLDFDSVQRGDPEMERRVYAVIMACVALGKENPIVSAHDLGAGGDCNAIPEIVDPAGARVTLHSIPCGDQSLSSLEMWGNESQERVVFLVRPEQFQILRVICEREGAPCAVVGEVADDGWLEVYDAGDDSTPVRLPLQEVLGKLPPKTFQDNTRQPVVLPLKLPRGLTVRAALDRVLRLVTVGSKEFLTRKVDRSVRGLTPQQQCVGPNHLPVADFAIRADSYIGLSGAVHSLGERPIPGLLSPEAMARLTVAEALLNMVGAGITDLGNVSGSANWMLAAKQPGEGAWLFAAATALRDICLALGIKIDGGKDSLSMAAKMQPPQGVSVLVKAPGTLVFSAYVDTDDITRKVTPDLKGAGNTLLLIDLGQGKDRLGGSALAQVFGQLGDVPPDVDDASCFKRAFVILQRLLKDGLILSLHDRSDGGLIVTLLEMAFAGNLGLDISLTSQSSVFEALFSEEPGVVIECADPLKVMRILQEVNVPAEIIGRVTDVDRGIIIRHNETCVLWESMTDLRDLWEATSYELDRLQANPACVESERAACRNLITPPPYHLTFVPRDTSHDVLFAREKPKVAILREEGSNGEREMAAAFSAAGFEPWDVTMKDLRDGRISLDLFRGIVFVGGFSFADVFDSGKGWAGVIRFNPRIQEELERFRARPDTFSLGICNGCQLMALLGWVPGSDGPVEEQPRFIRNASGRFESRFSALQIEASPAVLLQGMAGSILGVWVSHGEGRLHIPSSRTERLIHEQQLVPARYVDPVGKPTVVYPFNPNGSPEGAAGLCSPDGRHLALMPHPERTFLTWQWPWMPSSWKTLEASPWLQMFQNAYEWCMRK